MSPLFQHARSHQKMGTTPTEQQQVEEMEGIGYCDKLYLKGCSFVLKFAIHVVLLKMYRKT
uniref:Uncharacterized protein n=1 Tax=Oryza brachyantha TaxID=4533 RepID=J3KV00_ORYBR